MHSPPPPPPLTPTQVERAKRRTLIGECWLSQERLERLELLELLVALPGGLPPVEPRRAEAPAASRPPAALRRRLCSG